MPLYSMNIWKLVLRAIREGEEEAMAHAYNVTADTLSLLSIPQRKTSNSIFSIEKLEN